METLPNLVCFALNIDKSVYSLTSEYKQIRLYLSGKDLICNTNANIPIFNFRHVQCN